MHKANLMLQMIEFFQEEKLFTSSLLCDADITRVLCLWLIV